MEIIAREFSEIDRVRRLWERLTESNSRRSAHFGGYFSTFQFDIRKRFLSEALEAGGQFRMFTLDGADGTSHGFCAVTYHSGQGCGDVEMLFVEEELRGLGWGSRLLERALGFLREQGVENIGIEVAYGNDPAIALYRRFGFEIFTVSMLPLSNNEGPRPPKH